MSNFDFTKCRNNFCADNLLKTLQRAETQYPPLKADEEKNIIQEYMACGKEKELRNKLAMHHIRYCYRLARTYSRTTVDFDEMIGNAIEGLFIAADKFDFSKGVRFITYAQPYIFRGLMKEYYDKTQQAVNAGVSLDRPILMDEPGGAEIINVIDGIADDVSKGNKTVDPGNGLDAELVGNIVVEVMKYIRDSIDFSDFDRYIFVRGIIGKVNMKEISKSSGVPYYKINKQKAEILDRLKDFIQKKFQIKSLNGLFE